MAEPRPGNDRLREAGHRRIEFVVRHAQRRKSHRLCLTAVVLASGEHHLARLVRADPSRQPLGHPPAGNQREACVRVRETRGLGRHDQVGGQRKFKSAGDAVAMDRADGRLGQVGELLDHRRLVVLPRRPGRPRDIRSARETAAGAAQHYRADLVCPRRDVVEEALQRLEHLNIQGVALRGTVEC
jgi:hypothetical protein